MFNVKETPPRYTSSFALHNSALKDISFTSYLMKPKDIVKTSQNECGFSIDDTELGIFDAHTYFSESNDPKEVEKPQQLEEEKSQDLVAIDKKPSSVSSVDGYGRNFPRTRSFDTTPMASISEASWNSRTGLLMVNPTGVSLKNFPSSDGNKRRFAAKKWFLDRKSNCCIGKKTVQVKEAELESENTMPDSIKIWGKNTDEKDSYLPTDFLKSHQQKKFLQENNLESTQEALKQRVSAEGRPFIDQLRRFSFPIVNHSNLVNEDYTRALKNIGRKSNTSPLEDPPRKSLEVFRAILDLSSVLGPKNLISDRVLFDPGSPIAGVTNIDDDIGSDASSDLFEIDSLSAPTSCNSMHCRRDNSVEEPTTFNARSFAIAAHGINVTRKVEFDMKSLDGPRAASEYYPPSEDSIDWSVATAEGLDKASITTNISASTSEICIADTSGRRLEKQEEVGGHGGWRKRNGLLLMGCREEKAVSVGPQPVKRVAPGQRILSLPEG